MKNERSLSSLLAARALARTRLGHAVFRLPHTQMNGRHEIQRPPRTLPPPAGAATAHTVKREPAEAAKQIGVSRPDASERIRLRALHPSHMHLLPRLCLSIPHLAFLHSEGGGGGGGGASAAAAGGGAAGGALGGCGRLTPGGGGSGAPGGGRGGYGYIPGGGGMPGGAKPYGGGG